MQKSSEIYKKNTCAVIVTFNPDDSFKERLIKIKQQFTSVIIVDNASSNKLKNLLSNQWDEVFLLQNNTNLGIATALNQGIEKAIELEYQWFVTFDQDSDIDDTLLDSIQKIYSSINYSSVIIGSNYWNLNKEGLAYSCKKKNLNYIERKTVITSGMCFSREMIKDIGFFKDSYFIDSVDHEFCLRARSKNYKIFLSCNPLMKHSIGEKKDRTDGLNNIVFSHSSDRVYYMARNTLVTVRRFYKAESIWSMCQILRLTVEFIAITLQKKERSKKVQSFLKGLNDGIYGKMGRRK